MKTPPEIILAVFSIREAKRLLINGMSLDDKSSSPSAGNVHGLFLLLTRKVAAEASGALLIVLMTVLVRFMRVSWCVILALFVGRAAAVIHTMRRFLAH